MHLFSFDRQANHYLLHSSLQEKIAKYLISKSMDSSISRILDLGAGSGNVVNNLSCYKIDYFLGIDCSSQMLSLHPTKMSNIKHIQLKHLDFESYDFDECFDLIISSSSLHWARNLESIFYKIQNQSRVGFSIFTSKSLESLHHFLDSTSPLKSYDEVAGLLDKYFVGEMECRIFKENFSNREDLLNHLRYNGLLGGGNISFGAKKRLKFGFPNLFLEYEVLFFTGRSK